MTGTYARYLAGWAIVAALLAYVLTSVFPGVAGESGTAAALAGIAVCAVTDLVVFALVLRALEAPQDRFAKLWGLSLFLKVAIIGGAIGTVAVAGWFPVEGFVRVLIASFVVFAHHEILWLLVGQNRSRLKPARGPQPSRSEVGVWAVQAPGKGAASC